MDANIKITFDESALSRAYAWLLSLKNESVVTDRSGIREVPEAKNATVPQVQSDDTAHEDSHA